MSTSAQYASTVRTAVGQISAANTNRDGTGTLVDIFVAGSSGSRIDDITITATAATTAGVVRLFLNNGTTSYLWKEILVSAITPSTTVATWTYTLQSLALILKTGWKLQASTHNAEVFNVCVVRSGDF